MTIFYKKQFGQNFLLKRSIAKQLVEAASVTKDDTVVEVGAGAGMVTQYLCEEAGKLIAVEIDKRFIKMLKSRFLDDTHVTISHGDILHFKPEDYNLGAGQYKVVGSLPYNISKKIIKFFFENSIQPSDMSFIIQKEVAEDYTAQVPKATFLSNYANLFSDVAYISTVAKRHFKPEPQVDGAIIAFHSIHERFENVRKFSSFLKAAFANPRKMLINNLESLTKMSKKELQNVFKEEAIDLKARASDVTLEQWHSLFQKLKYER